MKMLAVLLALSAVALAPVPSWAQLDNGTVDVFFQELTASGALEGCSLVFSAIEQDYSYRSGKQVLMNGSVALRILDTKQGLVFAGKLGTRDLSVGSKWVKPAYFYFASAHGTTAGHAIITESGTEGYKLLLGDASAESILRLVQDMAERKEFRVGFNRKPGGQDVNTTIKMNIALKKDAAGHAQTVKNDETARDFFNCTSRLASSLLPK